MIISETNQFVFIKGRKVAGTSVEVGLTSLCDRKDILTPITPIDEVVRFRTARLMAQNYGADPDKLKAYRRTIRQIKRGAKGNWAKIRKPRGRFIGHMPFNQIEGSYGTIPSNWTIIGITRCPYEQALSRIKHMANKQAMQEQSESYVDVDSSYFQQAKTKFIGRAAEKNLRLNIDLYKDSQNSLRPNFYLRYENLNDDYKKLLAQLGKTDAPELPHLKKTITSQKLAAQDLFSRDELDILNRCFEEEFKTFNYTFI
jgi:hypothetical protein